jgi:hypothetical protein
MHKTAKGITDGLHGRGAAPLHICISENRRQDEVGVKLLVLSLTRHEPDAILHLYVDDLSDGLKDWLGAFPHVVQEHLAIDPALTWNIKAKLFLDLFHKGLTSIVWIDSDIIVTAPVGHFFAARPDALLIAQEFYRVSYKGVAGRTQGWGLPAGRDLPFTPNSCVMRMTRDHLPLLAAWQALLDRPDYLAMQARPWTERPFYMMGDQEALSALMGSRDFADIAVQPLRRGRDIAQCHQPDGYSPAQRLANRGRLPPFVHAQGEKPWRLDAAARTYHHVSPYWYAAQPYRDALLPRERGWLDQRPAQAVLLDRLAFGNPNLAGFLPALTFQIGKYAAAARRSVQRKLRL